MASRIVRHVVPVAATVLFPGTIFADGPKRPHPAAVYAEAQECTPDQKGSSGKDGSCPVSPDCTDTELEKLVMKAREELVPIKDTMIQYADDGMRQARCYYDRLQSNICYLRTRAPDEVRMGTVAAGGLTGLLLGIRGGMIKKLFMTSLGVAGGSYLAYPNETEKFAKKYSAIAYNFVTGTDIVASAPANNRKHVENLQ